MIRTKKSVNAHAFIIASFYVYGVVPAAEQTEPFSTKIASGPAVRQRHTLLLASFDRADGNDADYARCPTRRETRFLREYGCRLRS